MAWLRSLALIVLLTPLAMLGQTRLSIQGETNVNGVFDPSVEYDATGSVGWLAYSSVYGSVQPWGANVDARLATTSNAGASWSFVKVLNASFASTLVRPGMPDLDGVWNYETTSLVHDPGDTGAEWKIFSHRVFRKTEDGFVDEQNVASHSWIVLRSASDPADVWSQEVALLASGPLPPPPYDTVQVAVNDLDPSLADLLVYSEPGAFVRGGVLYLSLTGLDLAGPNRIVLLASDDHGASWRYVGTPLSNADAVAIGYQSFDGSALVEEYGQIFLLVTPQSETVTHDGTMIFEFEDLALGTLERDAGVPLVHAHLPAMPGLPADRRGGQADFHAHNTQGGLLMPSLQLEDYPVFFQIFATGERLVIPAVPGPQGAGMLVGVLLLLAVARLRTRFRRRSPGSPGRR